MEKMNLKLYLKSTNLCFLCFNKEESYGYKNSFPLKNILRYLKVDLREVKSLREGTDIEVNLCPDCEIIMQRFLENYKALEMCRLRLECSLDEIDKKLVNDGNCSGAKTSPDFLHIMKELRQEMNKMCGTRKRKDADPLVVLERIEEIASNTTEKDPLESSSNLCEPESEMEPGAIKIEYILPETEDGKDIKPEVDSDEDFNADEQYASSSDREWELNEDLRHYRKKKSFTCSYCQKVYPSHPKEHYKTHIMRHRGVKPFKCSECPKAFVIKTDLESHFRRHTGEKPFKCQVCKKGFSQRGLLRRHYTLDHPDSDVISSIKPFPLRTYPAKSRRKIRIVRDPILTCSVCNERVLRKRFKTHMMKHSGERPYQCDQCPKAFIERGHLNIHLKIHAGERPFKCEKCDRRFTIRGSLKTHMDRVHSGEATCPACDKVLPDRHQLHVHSFSECPAVSRPFKCDLCDKSFTIKYHWKSHQMVHTGEKPYKCNQCLSTFSQVGSLNVHIRTVHGDKTQEQLRKERLAKERKEKKGQEEPVYQCDQCPKSFKYLTSFTQHMVTHSGDRPFKCQHCPRRFGQRSALITHSSVMHAGKEETCGKCGKTLEDKEQLRMHIYKCPASNRPYACNFCELRFQKPNHLKIHERVHTKEKPYQCEICQNKFTQKGSLNSHMRKVHGKMIIVKSRKNKKSEQDGDNSTTGDET